MERAYTAFRFPIPTLAWLDLVLAFREARLEDWRLVCGKKHSGGLALRCSIGTEHRYLSSRASFQYSLPVPVMCGQNH
jgi:hypothetical protein